MVKYYDRNIRQLIYGGQSTKKYWAIYGGQSTNKYWAIFTMSCSSMTFYLPVPLHMMTHWKSTCFNKVGLHVSCIGEVENVKSRTYILWPVILQQDGQTGWASNGPFLFYLHAFAILRGLLSLYYNHKQYHIFTEIKEGWYPPSFLEILIFNVEILIFK